MSFSQLGFVLVCFENVIFYSSMGWCSHCEVIPQNWKDVACQNYLTHCTRRLQSAIHSLNLSAVEKCLWWCYRDKLNENCMACWAGLYSWSLTELSWLIIDKCYLFDSFAASPAQWCDFVNETGPYTWHLFVKQFVWSGMHCHRSDTVWHSSVCSDSRILLSGVILKLHLFHSRVSGGCVAMFQLPGHIWYKLREYSGADIRMRTSAFAWLCVIEGFPYSFLQADNMCGSQATGKQSGIFKCKICKPCMSFIGEFFQKLE